MNKIFKSLILSLTSISSIALIGSCANPLFSVNHNAANEDIFILGPRVIDLGVEYTYTAKILPEGVDQSVVWSVSNSQMASITQDGVLTATNFGLLDVIATSSSNPDISTKYQIKILQPEPTSLKIVGPQQVVVKSETRYSVDVTPSVAKNDVLWRVEPSSLATILPNGELDAYKEGDATITVTSKSSPKIYDTLVVSIILPEPESIKIKGNFELDANSTAQFDVDTEPKEAYKEVRWTIEDTTLAEIEETTGIVTTKDTPGSVNITAHAYFNGKEIAHDTREITIGKYFDVVVSETIGTAFTVASKRITPNQEHKLRFISSTYAFGQKKYPTHKYLRKSDIQVLHESTNITDDCSLINNELTIPANYCDQNIKINILGAEISDVMSWNTLMEIGDSDVFDEEDIAKKYFQIGDYKMVTHENKNVSFARIIDFYHDTYRAVDPTTGKQVESQASFSFEFEQPAYYKNWGGKPIGSGIIATPQFYDPECDVATYLLNDFECDSLFTDTTSIVRTCLVPMSENHKIVQKQFRFWPMSLFEALGQEPPEENQDGEYGGPEGKRYAYYNDDAGYQSTFSAAQRLIKNVDLSKTKYNEFLLRTTGKYRGENDWYNYNINNTDGTRTTNNQSYSDMAFCPVFCI